MPVIARVVEEEHYEGRIMVPLTDGKRLFQIVVSARQAYDTGCRCIVKEWQQHVVLHTIDELSGKTICASSTICVRVCAMRRMSRRIRW